ncbi:hypothetical protein KI688_011167 [Linnemannia hyalina]|uniref:Uncharacterized protein n=1 Tax=Linnemannia hyalina TaxID=64524 RepID=A0A9P7XZ61_9FUNG|nr:hypothetical protein KI688_011167 [Linnemannia hyalina]
MNNRAGPPTSGSTDKTTTGASSQDSFAYEPRQNNGPGASGGGSGAGGGGYYIPPASELTSSNHDRALGVIDAAFEGTDRMLDERDMKAFGDNSESIFQELIKIRLKQLALAAKHIEIETVAEDDKSLAPDGKLLDAADKDEIDPLQFARKGQELQVLMSSLEDLGRSMSDFHELSNSTNKQPFSSTNFSRK